MVLIAGGRLRLNVADDDFVRPWRPHETVVLQHGFCRNGGFWAPWVPYLGHEFRVLRPDLRGCGKSSDPGPDYELTIDDYVDDLIRVMDQLEVDTAHYIGEATGAFIGMAAAARHPGRIRSLTLFNTPSGADHRTREVFALGYPSWAAAVRDLGVEGWWRRAGAAAGRGGSHASEDRAAAEHYAREVGRTPVHVAIAMLSLSSAIDVPSLLRGVSVPTRFLTTTRYSFNTSREQLESLARHVPGAVIKEFDVRNRGGLYCFHDSETIAPEVIEFLRSVDGPGARAGSLQCPKSTVPERASTRGCGPT
ncbi:MAG TPA: alpha/beta hydrolase [Amycolatopsis sp.]|nr:alpha/beta hydrolase [Amycolatopsis sp.]